MSDRGRSSRHGVSTPGNGAGLTKLGDVDSLPAMVWLADGDRQLLDANAAWRRFEGSDASTTWDAGIHPEDAPRCCAAFARAVAAAQEFRLRYRRRRSDGAYRWLFDVATPRPDPETGALHYLGTLLEIDDTRHADDLAAAHRATRDLMEVAEAASHDMREPLASATICAELIKRQNAEGMHSGTGELIGHVQKAVATMYRSLEELVAYLRLERDFGEGVMAPADCDVVVRGVVESLAEALETTGGSIRVGGKLPVVVTCPP